MEGAADLSTASSCRLVAWRQVRSAQRGSTQQPTVRSSRPAAVGLPQQAQAESGMLQEAAPLEHLLKHPLISQDQLAAHSRQGQGQKQRGGGRRACSAPRSSSGSCASATARPPRPGCLWRPWCRCGRCPPAASPRPCNSISTSATIQNCLVKCNVTLLVGRCHLTPEQGDRLLTRQRSRARTQNCSAPGGLDLLLLPFGTEAQLTFPAAARSCRCL